MECDRTGGGAHEREDFMRKPIRSGVCGGGSIIERIRRSARYAPLAGSVVAASMWAATAHAGATIKFGEDQSLSAGIGLRSSFAAVEDGAGKNNDSWSKDFNIDNARIYLSGQINKWLKAELNTDCVFCGDANLRDFALLDAIAKIEPSPYFNIWGGRLLVPSERAEMDGPFYGNVHENFKTPFYSSDYSVKFGSGGAGVYGRDHGVNFWGDAGKLKYVFGIFNGLRGDANADDNPLFATRIAYQFLNKEDNPGYYTSSTYFGSAGDILTLAVALQYQEDGAGSTLHPGDFFGMNVDALFEKPVAGVGTFTLEAAAKYFDWKNNVAAYADPDNFGMFDGEAFTGTALYLLPNKTGPGTFQPYLRFTQINADGSADRNEFESGLNYVIAGHNARVSLFYQYGDLASKSLVDFSPGVSGDKVSAIKLAIQLQI